MNNNFHYEDILERFPSAEPIATGGQKVVFAVEHPEYGEAVLKIGHYRSTNSLRRIKREVMVLREVDSEYFPTNYGFEVLDNQRFIIVEEKIKGKPLSERIEDFSGIDRASILIEDLVTGLRILWDRRIVHRDIKPQNIMITSPGRPVIVDLGIARVLDMESLTKTYQMRGPCTPAYASPEQLENRKRQINHRSDQFSLGIVYAQLLLEGQHPFDPQVVKQGDSFIDNILNNTWARQELNREYFTPVRPILEKMLGHEPHERYRTPELLHLALKSLID
jgi:serine/threonine-protein kinase